MRFLLLLGFLLFSLPGQAQQIMGQASVIEGDIIEVGGVRIRLHGIDAPESDQSCRDASGKDYRCGQKAVLVLSGLIGKTSVSCHQEVTDRDGRIVATCKTSKADLNQTMVRQGWAVADQEFSSRYVADERLARASRTGLWSGSFEPPSEWQRKSKDAIIQPVESRSLGTTNSVQLASFFAGYLVLISFGTFLAFAWDKHRARNGLYRISEGTLLTLTAVGGTIGALVGQKLLRHKTQKQPFKTQLYVIIGLQIVVLVALSLLSVCETVWQMAYLSNSAGAPWP